VRYIAIIVLLGTALTAIPAFGQLTPLWGPGNPQYDVTHSQERSPSSSPFSSRPNPLGGYDYSSRSNNPANRAYFPNGSNEMSCRPNPVGGMDCR